MSSTFNYIVSELIFSVIERERSYIEYIAIITPRLCQNELY